VVAVVALTALVIALGPPGGGGGLLPAIPFSGIGGPEDGDANNGGGSGTEPGRDVPIAGSAGPSSPTALGASGPGGVPNGTTGPGGVPSGTAAANDPGQPTTTGPAQGPPVENPVVGPAPSPPSTSDYTVQKCSHMGIQMTRTSGSSLRWPTVQAKACVHKSGAGLRSAYADVFIFASNAGDFGSGARFRVAIKIELRRCGGAVVQSLTFGAAEQEDGRQEQTGEHAADPGGSYAAFGAVSSIRFVAEGSVWTGSSEQMTSPCQPFPE
jgi:hypothetical protein